MNDYYLIWKDILWFNPIHNTNLTWWGSLGIIGFNNRGFVIGLAIVLLWLGIRIYSYWIAVLNKRGKLVQITATLLFAGLTCSLIDSLFWNGSVDYIQFSTWFIFDLKDCYLCGVAFLIIISELVYGRNSGVIDLKDIGKYCLMLKRKNNN